MSVLAAILAAHAALLVLMGIVRALGGVSFGGPTWVVAVIVPVAGPAMAFALTVGERMPNAGARAENFDQARAADLGEEPLVSAENARETVSLEDAMLVSDQSTRRELMMDVLLYDGDATSSSLARARSSSDTEVAHYASSAMMEVSSGYDELLTFWSLRFSEDPDDAETVRRYLDILERYLESGLAEGSLRHMQEVRYRQVLEKKIETDPEEVDFANLAGSFLSEGRAEDAEPIITRMEGQFPDLDDTLLLRMRYWYVLKRPDEIQKVVRSCEGRHVGARVRAVLDFWEKVD